MAGLTVLTLSVSIHNYIEAVQESDACRDWNRIDHVMQQKRVEIEWTEERACQDHFFSFKESKECYARSNQILGNARAQQRLHQYAKPFFCRRK